VFSFFLRERGKQKKKFGLVLSLALPTLIAKKKKGGDRASGFASFRKVKEVGKQGDDLNLGSKNSRSTTDQKMGKRKGEERKWKQVLVDGLFFDFAHP